MRKLLLLLLAVCFVVSAAHAVDEQLLANGGFELPGVAHGPISESGDWTEYGTVSQKIQIAGWASNEGAAGAWLQGWNNNRDGGFYQDVTAAAGFTYTLSGQFRIESGFAATGGTGGTGTLDMELVWLDASDAVISTSSFDVVAAQAADGGWYTQTLVAEAPNGTAKARAQIHWTTGDQSAVPNPRSSMVDDMKLLGPSVLFSATNPDPDHESAQDPLSVTQLCFDTPAGVGNVQTIEYDLYWSVDDGGAGVTDPNASPELSGTADPNETVCNAVPEVITSGHTYYWKVDLNIIGYDPNDPGYDPNDPGVTGFFPGAVWNFKTESDPPVITINTQEYNTIWLSSGSVDLDLDATVTDDGLPNPPGVVTTTWTSNPSTGVSFADASSPVTTVTFTAADSYELTLTANDGDGDVAGTPTVKVTVYAEGDDGLVARYEFEGDYTDSVGGHHGTAEGGATIDSDAKVGTGSLLCSTTGDYVVVLDSGVADPNWDAGVGDPNYVDPAGTWADFQTTNQMTVSAWVKIEAWSAAWQSMVNKGDGWALQRNGADDTSQCMHRLGSGTNSDPRGERSARDNDAISIYLSDGNWHHLAGTFDGYVNKIYVDGVLEGVNNNASDYLNDMPLGGARIIMGLNGNMRLDQVRLHDAPLTADMIWDQFVGDGGENSCRQQYILTDLNEDCSTDLGDLAVVAADWLLCSDLTDPSCTLPVPDP